MSYYRDSEARNGYVTPRDAQTQLMDQTWSGAGVRGDFYQEPDPISAEILKRRGVGAKGTME